MSSAVIEVRDLQKTFPIDAGWRGLVRGSTRRHVLRGLDIDVYAGQIVGLLGPNGAGKTTLIKILSGLILPDSGQVRVAGSDIVKHPENAQRAIGVVYGDERSFYWRLSLYENLRFYSSLYGHHLTDADARIWSLIRGLNLEQSAHMRMYTFSAGMKQRAAIARGLLNDPEILFMDEPTRGLDPLGVEDLHHLIRERVVSVGRTLLLATNVMSEAEALCDRVILIGQGLIQAEGTIEQLRAWARRELVYNLVVHGSATDYEQRLGAIPGVMRVDVRPIDGPVQTVQLAIDRAGDALPIAIRTLVEQSVEIRACTKEEPSLEEIFLDVMRQPRLEMVGTRQ